MNNHKIEMKIFDYMKSLDKVSNITSMTPESLDNMSKKIKELAETHMMEEMSKAFVNFDTNTATSTSSTSQFTEKELEKTFRMIKNMEPIVIEIEVYKNMWYKLKECIPETDTNLPDYLGYFPRIDGVRLIAVLEDEDFNEKQARLNYNNGTSKIIDLFKEE